MARKVDGKAIIVVCIPGYVVIAKVWLIVRQNVLIDLYRCKMLSNLTAINSTIHTSLSMRRSKFEFDFVVAIGLDLEILAWDCC